MNVIAQQSERQQQRRKLYRGVPRTSRDTTRNKSQLERDASTEGHRKGASTGDPLIFPVLLPYYDGALPAKLPTRDEIERSRNVLTDKVARKVIALAPHFVVKYGVDVDLEEGQMMIFIQKNTDIPIPRIYALYHESGANYIVMEYIQGPTLEELWPDLSQERKLAICSQIKRHFRTLRQIQSPKSYCSLGGQPLRSQLFRMNGVQHGPFNTESDLIDSFLRKYSYRKGELRAAFMNELLPVLLGHPPILAHGDPQRKNFLIGPNDRVVFGDWGDSGFYPGYWDYASAINAYGVWQDDWPHWINQFLDPYPLESLVFKTLQADILF